MSPKPAPRSWWFALVAAAVASPSVAHADPIRLRADALAQTRAPTGMLVLSGEDRERPWLDAEALVWTGTKRSWETSNPEGDVLVATVRVREPKGRVELRAGRFVMTTGAIRPVHLDGAVAQARAPWGTGVEAFGGIPVVPRFGARASDWVVGGRASQTVATYATAGVSYEMRRTGGMRSTEESGVDFALMPVRWLDVAGRGAWDLIERDLAEAHGSLAARGGPVRFEVFGMRRSPSRLLPATSLFSVLGDLPATTVGSTLRLAAAPRLDFLATGAGQRVGDDTGGNGSLKATLRLDDRGLGAVSVEGRRQSVSTARWYGLRVAGMHPIVARLSFATELELVKPDDDSHGKYWTWGLGALTWRFASGWDVAGAVEASVGRQDRYEVDGLLRASYRWGSL